MEFIMDENEECYSGRTPDREMTWKEKTRVLNVSNIMYK